MKTSNIIRLIFLTSILFSCGDCLQHVTGTVVDYYSEQPIDSVYVQKENKKFDFSYTNKEGEFEIRSISGGLFKCPAMTVILKKDGYENMMVKIKPAKHKNIKLKKLK